MKAELRIHSRTLLFVTFAAALASTACGNDVETLPPDENGGTGGMPATGGTTAIAGSGGTSGSATGGTAGAPSTGGSAGSTGGAAGSAGSSTGGSAGSAGSATGGTAGSAGSSAGMAGSGGTGGFTPVTWQELSFTINGSCAKTMCHNGMQAPPLLAIPAATQYATLTTHPVSVCGTATRLVAPGDVANSAILKLVNGECMLDGEVFMMPADCAQAPCLPSAQIATITNWILSGAPGPQ